MQIEKPFDPKFLGLSRREFIRISAGIIPLAASCRFEMPDLSKLPKLKLESTRTLGNTGVKVTAIGLGGQGQLQNGDEKNALAIIRHALDLGINYFDTAPAYGPSQDYLGKGLKDKRKDIFLAAKTSRDDRDGALRQLDNSLKRLQTDHVDLWQIHNMHDDNEVNEVLGKNGAIRALEEAKKDKRVKFLGITGHTKPGPLLHAIKEFPFDTLLLSINAADRHYESFLDKLVPIAIEKKIAIIAMKVMGCGAFMKQASLKVSEAIGYVLSQPVSLALVGVDSPEQLHENARVAVNFKPFSKERLKEIEEKTKAHHKNINWFKHRYY